MDSFWHIFGALVLLFGLLDAWKYRILTNKITKYNSSKGQSRAFCNIAVVHKLFLSIWAIFYLHDVVVAVSTLLALYTSIQLWVTIWRFYPYYGRGRFGFKKPNICYYIYHSLLPNGVAKRI